MYPSEYAFHVSSVNIHESVSANCRNYPRDLLQGETIFTNEYTHCDGTQLTLANTNIGQEQYQPTGYYVWSAGSHGEQLLFIFPTRVSLTTITLHYYSDSVRGLPRLIFYAVPSDFDIWELPTTSYPHVDVVAVPPGGEPVGRKNVSINANFNTKKVLMYKHRSYFRFAVSEVQFFIAK